jgi:hypothetical protein
MIKFFSIQPVALAVLCLLTLVACSPEGAKPVAAVPAASLAAPNFGAVVDEGGHCTESISFDAARYKGKPDDALVGLSECQIVALHGEAPLSVMTGASPQSRRETTMLYMEPNGKAIYLFSDNLLKRVVR